MTVGDALPIDLTVNTPDILTGGKFCSNTFVTFTCTAVNVQVLRWAINGRERASFTSLDMPSVNPRQIDGLRAYLNSSVNDGRNILNVTSTLLGMASDFQNIGNISCLEGTGDTKFLNFTLISEFNC